MIWYLYLGKLFETWIETLFILPFRNWEMLWLLVPVWVAWFFAEFYQEKIGTSIGNAITNAVVVVWGSIDCSRQTVALIVNKTITSSFEIFLRFGLVAIIFIYGIIIVVLGIKARKLVKFIGRVRVVTYVFAMVVPIFYNAIPFSLEHLFAALLFFPVFYFLIEAIDKITPNPKAIIEDMSEKEKHHEQKQIQKEQPQQPISHPYHQYLHQHNQPHTHHQYQHPGQNQNNYNPNNQNRPRP